MPSFSRALHMALTVRDMRVSADWYRRVLGFEFVKEFQVAPGDAGIPRITSPRHQNRHSHTPNGASLPDKG